MNENLNETEATLNVVSAATAPADEKAVEDNTIDVVGVVFRSSPKAYFFAPGKLEPKKGDAVIVETARGTEYGTIKFGRRRISEKELVSPLKPIVRIATEDDKERHEGNRMLEKSAMRICREKIAEHKLDMNLVDAAYTFDNRKLFFYFTSDARVDFRDLVKDLASVFKVRIDLRQIGIRDEAKMLGGLGVCGRPFCCAGFLSDFAQVSIKMAKEQNFSLNSSKISGSCGRLMCCLRYEHETYETALRELPPIGSLVSTPAGNGTVIEVKPLATSVKVRLDDKDETQKTFTMTDIRVLRAGKQRQEPKQEPKNEQKSEGKHKNKGSRGANSKSKE